MKSLGKKRFIDSTCCLIEKQFTADIQCQICDLDLNNCELIGDSEKEISENLFKSGWRTMSVDCIDQIGFTCPNCCKLSETKI